MIGANGSRPLPLVLTTILHPSQATGCWVYQHQQRGRRAVGKPPVERRLHMKGWVRGHDSAPFAVVRDIRELHVLIEVVNRNSHGSQTYEIEVSSWLIQILLVSNKHFVTYCRWGDSSVVFGPVWYLSYALLMQVTTFWVVVFILVLVPSCVWTVS